MSDVCIRCGRGFRPLAWKRGGTVNGHHYSYHHFDCLGDTSKVVTDDLRDVFRKGPVLCSCGAPLLFEHEDTIREVKACFKCKKIHTGQHILDSRKWAEVVVISPSMKVE